MAAQREMELRHRRGLIDITPHVCSPDALAMCRGQRHHVTELVTVGMHMQMRHR